MPQFIIDEPEERYYFTAWVYTYESFVEHPEWVIEFIESTFSFAAPFSYDLELVANPHLQNKKVRRKFTPQTWGWCKDQLTKGNLELVLIAYTKDFAAPKELFPAWAVNMADALNKIRESKRKRAPVPENTEAMAFWEAPIPSELRFIIELPLTIERVSEDLQVRLVHFGRTTFVRVNAIYGFINFSRRPASADVGGTEYERKRGVFGSQTNYVIDRKVRGAFWENYLTEGHIQRLGGVSAVKAHAPCARVEELISGKALALRLTEDVNDLTPEAIQKLEEYFRPLAPSRDMFDASAKR